MQDSWCLGSQYWSKNKHRKNYFAKYGILLDMVGGPNAKFYEENKLELYNLKNDLGEETDLSVKYPLIVKKLSNKMDEMLIEMNGKLPTINKNLN